MNLLSPFISFTLQVWATAPIPFKRLLTQQFLSFPSIVGLMIASGFILSFPLYADATYFRLLREELLLGREAELTQKPVDYAPLDFVFQLKAAGRNSPAVEERRRSGFLSFRRDITDRKPACYSTGPPLPHGRLFHVSAARPEQPWHQHREMKRVDRLLDRATDSFGGVQKLMEQNVQATPKFALNKLGMPTRRDVADLSRRVELLTVKLQQVSAPRARRR